MADLQFLKDKTFLGFTIKFLVIFSILYLGTKAVIGLAVPGNHYSYFTDHYFDYISGIKNTLLFGVKNLLRLFSLPTVYISDYGIRITGGRGVIVSLSCVGYGVYSFWLAYSLAKENPWKRKILWAFGGLLLLWLINVIRITALLYTINHDQSMPLGIDHHTWFNIFAYMAIFVMIYFYERTHGLDLKDGIVLGHESQIP